jgi:DNA-binding FadR family transcriptional regulator
MAKRDRQVTAGSGPVTDRPAAGSPDPQNWKLGDHVYEQVLEMIMNGEFPENSRLPPEAELSARLGVSRPVLRQALRRLREDEIIQSRKGSGSYVLKRPDRSILNFAPVGSIADIQRSFEFRIAVEGEAARLAAERRTEEDLARIGAALEDLDECIRSGTLGADADEAFHLAVCEATGNRFFADARASMQAHIIFGMNLARSLSLTKPADRLELVQSEHVTIFEAIRDQDPTAAETAMRSHIENARRRVFEGQE